MLDTMCKDKTKKKDLTVFSCLFLPECCDTKMPSFFDDVMSEQYQCTSSVNQWRLFP